MGKQCEFSDACPMFDYFCRAAEAIYRHMYCEGQYETCERRKLRLTGQSVPVNLLPQGMKLWPDGGEPPDKFYLS